MAANFPYAQFEVVRATTSTTNDASFLSAAFDSAGARAMRVIIKLGAITAGATMTVCKIQSSATSGGTYADVTGLAFTTFPTDAKDNQLMIFEWDCINGTTKDRFYKVAYTTAGSQNWAVDTIIAERVNLLTEPPSAANTVTDGYIVRV